MKTILGTTTLQQVFQRYGFLTHPGRYLLTGLPGCVDVERHLALHAYPGPIALCAIEARLYQETVRGFEILRSHRQGPRPATMLLRAYGWHWHQQVDVALLPYMDDLEAEAWTAQWK